MQIAHDIFTTTDPDINEELKMVQEGQQDEEEAQQREENGKRKLMQQETIKKS